MRLADSLPRIGALAALWLVTFGLCAFSALFFGGAVGITPIWLCPIRPAEATA